MAEHAFLPLAVIDQQGTFVGRQLVDHLLKGAVRDIDGRRDMPRVKLAARRAGVNDHHPLRFGDDGIFGDKSTIDNGMEFDHRWLGDRYGRRFFNRRFCCHQRGLGRG